MAIQIINCPSCDTFMLDDTAECPQCGHIVHAVRAEEVQRRELPTDAAVDDNMDICPKCRETCRKGLVRCWSCGTFLRADIEAEFLRRRGSAAQAPIETFDLEVIEESSVTEQDSIKRRHLATPESLISAPVAYEDDSEGGDDFELSDDVHMSEVDEDDFDLGESVQFRTDDSNSDDEAPTFRLQLPSASASNVTETPVESSATDLAPPLACAELEVPAIPLLDSVDSKDTAGAALPLQALDSKAVDTKASPVETEEEALLKIAAAEEAEIRKARKASVAGTTFIVYCPQGHRIRVRERFRGKKGTCPKCSSVFVVPLKSRPNPEKKTDTEIPTAGVTAAPVGRYAGWLQDVRLHSVVPEKLKLKADSLLNDFTSVDVGLSSDEIAILTLVGTAGLFGANLKKKPAIRAAMLEHLAKPGANLEGLAVSGKRIVPKDGLSQIVLVQPKPDGTESLFGDIPVFGTGRIAVRLPKLADDKSTFYLSFTLSEFRLFSGYLESLCGVVGFGANSEIPLSDSYETYKCHFLETPVQDLAKVDYYRKDPSFKLEIGGWKCAGCGLVVSEDGRKKEKLGGLNGKGLAKAKCPKCTKPFGTNSLVHLAGEVNGGAPSGTAETPVSSEQ